MRSHGAWRQSPFRARPPKSTIPSSKISDHIGMPSGHRLDGRGRDKELADRYFANTKTKDPIPHGRDAQRPELAVGLRDELRSGPGQSQIHSKASLYQAFPAIEARRFEWHYTPNGSWLDLAESELSVLSSQCLDRRIPDKQTL